MKGFFRNAGRGYMSVVKPVNASWALLFSREWRPSTENVLGATILLAALIPITPFAYLCVAPFVAFLEGMREEGE